MAVLHKMKIVLPSWISAVGEAWRGAKDMDLGGVSHCRIASALCADAPSVAAGTRSFYDTISRINLLRHFLRSWSVVNCPE